MFERRECSNKGIAAQGSVFLPTRGSPLRLFMKVSTARKALVAYDAE